MTSNATPRLLEPKGARAVFYRDPGLAKSTDRIPVWLTYSAPVLHHVIPAAPIGTNSSAVGFTLVASPDGAVRVYSRPAGEYLGLVERGFRGWLQRLQLERQARKRAQNEREALRKSEKAALVAAEILKETN